MKDRRSTGGTILFLSDVSDRTWPESLSAAFTQHRVVTGLADADPNDTIAALVWKHPYGALTPYRNLRILINLGAGVDHTIGDHALPSGVPVVRLVDAGLAARMAEYVLMHCLALHRRVPELRRAQAAAHWNFVAPTPAARTCVGILGFGKLGVACAHLLSHVGFEVIGCRRTRGGDVSFHVYSEDNLAEFCERADILVTLLPLTTATRGLIDGRFFSRMRPGAALINVGRGELIVEDDLIAALDSGVLYHAVLDVFKAEPLPAEHPFWSHSRITITPHNSSATDPSTALQQVSENIQRALAGEALLNRVDCEAGY